MSDQHPPPYGDGSNQPPYQPPPAGGGFPPPTSGAGYPPPSPTSGSGYQPPPGYQQPPPGYPPTSGAGGYPPPPPTSGGGFPPPTSGAGQPGYGGYDPNAQPGYPPPPGDPNAPPGYGPPPGYDPHQQPFGAAPGAPLPPMTPPARSGGKLKIILAVVGALLLLCCVGGVALAVQSDIFGGGAGSADVGDCLAGKSIDSGSDQFQEADLEVVECSDGEAKYKVVGKVEDKTQAEATEDVCRQFTGAELIYWEGRQGEEGTVLCLQTNP